MGTAAASLPLAVYLGNVRSPLHAPALAHGSALTVLLVALCLVLSACGSQQSLNPTPLPTLAPTITATPEVGFVVNVTAVATARPHPVQPTPTRFVPPASPYIVLSSASGPPMQRVVVVSGGHLPPSTSIQLEWSLGGKSSPISTTAQTGRGGGLRSTFTIPASPPGKYRVLATTNGTIWASTVYRVRSAATLSGSVSSVVHGERVTVAGKHFLPRVKLLLIAYPMSVRGKPVIIGTARSDGSGAFTYTRTIGKLPLGEYALRAWSQDALAAQMAETFIQVVI